MLKVYNSLSRSKEIFKPINPKKISLYVCGVTVYDYCHIGHARVYLAFDVIIRYFRSQGFEVTYIRNITDIDDKIIERAHKRNVSIAALTQEFIEAMQEDFRTLKIVDPTFEPRATHYIPQMIDMIQTLLDKGYAYQGDNGDIYYDVQQYKSYGCLSHRNLAALQVGARIEVSESKRNPLDFVLWKVAKPGEPSWAAPWGYGRPGWHIECSAMAFGELGETLDIHGGGPDLKFPHHENERAQSEAANDKIFVNYWMHVGYVQQDKEKMSKSLGNFLTVRDFLKEYDAEVLRYFAIGSHYRSPVDYSLEHLTVARKALERLYGALRLVEEMKEGLAAIRRTSQAEMEMQDSKGGESHTESRYQAAYPMEVNRETTEFEARFKAAMEDDFNTPEAIAVLFDLARAINTLRKETLVLSKETQTGHFRAAIVLGTVLKKLGNLLGLLEKSPDVFFQNLQGKVIDIEHIEKLIEARNKARQIKDWKSSDKIRDELLAQGILLEDTTSGTRWHIIGK
jgi:cysteinyl-tRNA synthetase